MKAQIGIKEEALAKIALELSKILADEFVLYVKTRNAHWNVEGPDFHDKHIFFEAQYNAIDDIVDDVAERIRTIGHYAPASLKDYLKLTQLTEANREANDGAGFIKELLSDHEGIIIRLRENVDRFAADKDFGTSDFITGLMKTHEKMAWMLRSHLKG